jgi:hypothetical protein
MVSKYVLREQKTLGVAYDAAPEDAAESVSDDGPAVRTRWSGYFVYHLERTREEGGNVASKEMWAASREGWRSLTGRRRESYDDLALGLSHGGKEEGSSSEEDVEECEFDDLAIIPHPWKQEPREMSVPVAEQCKQRHACDRVYPVSPSMVDAAPDMKTPAEQFSGVQGEQSLRPLWQTPIAEKLLG